MPLRLRAVPTVLPLPQQQSAIPSPAGWVWDGANWTCNQPSFPAPCPPPCQPCPPCTDEFPPMPPGCPPWFPPPSGQAPWYPGANGGVSFSQDAPSCPVRGHFWFDGKVLWLFDGAAWVDVGLAGISTLIGQTGGATVFIGATAPPAAAPGLLWWNGTVLQLWDGVKWNVIGPSGATGAAAGGTVGIIFYTATQSIVIPTGATRAFVQMWGGTGGSGGTNNSWSAATGGAGYLEKFLAGLTAGNTINFTFGAAGTGGAPGAAGSNGGDSVLAPGTQSIPMMTAGGSPGTAGGTVTTFPGGFQLGGHGGTASGGDLNVNGSNGQDTIAEFSVPTAGENVFSVGAPGIGAQEGGTTPPTTGNNGRPGGLKITWYA